MGPVLWVKQMESVTMSETNGVVTTSETNGVITMSETTEVTTANETIDDANGQANSLFPDSLLKDSYFLSLLKLFPEWGGRVEGVHEAAAGGGRDASRARCEARRSSSPIW